MELDCACLHLEEAEHSIIVGCNNFLLVFLSPWFIFQMLDGHLGVVTTVRLGFLGRAVLTT